MRPKPGGRYVDATVGAGGHAAGILEKTQPDGELIGLDLDPLALSLAAENLNRFGSRVRLIHASYTRIAEEVRAAGWTGVDGIVADLGVSSMQLDQAEKGFSFQAEGPLDMRFDPRNPRSAGDLVNHLPEAELAGLIWQLGEERHARRIARRIVEHRPLHSTLELAEVISGAVPGKPGRLHPATRTFQALRIAVNGELEAIAEFLPAALGCLRPGGRLAVISFHSLEDRLVKQFFRREASDCICPPEQMVCTCGHKASLIEINRKPIEAAEEEKEENPRARSAKLRVAEKIC